MVAEDGTVHVHRLDSVSQDKVGFVCLVPHMFAEGNCSFEFFGIHSVFNVNCSGTQFSNSRSTSVFCQFSSGPCVEGKHLLCRFRSKNQPLMPVMRPCHSFSISFFGQMHV